MAPGIDLARVLAFCPDDPREAIMITPALRAVRRSFPSATVDIIAPPGVETIAAMLPFARHVSKRHDRGGREWICRMSSLHYDIAVIFTSPGQSPHADAYSCYLAGIPVRIGISAEFAGGVLSHWTKPLPNIHPVDRHFSLMASIGLANAGRRLELRLPLDSSCGGSEHPALRQKGQYAALICSGGADGALTGALVDRLEVPVVSARAMPDGVSLEYRSRGRDDIVIEEGEDRGTEMLEAELVNLALLTLTDDCLVALMAEAFGCPVLFFTNPAASGRQYWPMEATVLEYQEPDVDTIAACAQEMLASMRS